MTVTWRTALGAIAVLGCGANALADQLVTSQALPNGGARLTLDPTATFQAEGHVITSLTPGGVPSTFGGPDIAPLIGADRFYDAGFDGTGTISTNIEAGHLWSGHESLGHVTQFVDDAQADGGFDRHATWTGQAIGGRGVNAHQRGIAYGTDLRSGAIATGWAPDDPLNNTDYRLSFGLNGNTFHAPYASAITGAGVADVINGSYGIEDATGTNFLTISADGFAAENPTTTFVFSAGNTGNNANSVGGPGSGYNSITVGALRNNGFNVYDRVATFSSRGPQDYADAIGVNPVAGVRAGVDIVAPGHFLTLAYYGGSTGGNSGNPAVNDSDLYLGGLAGTSFSGPVVAGGVALMHDAADGLSLPATAHDSRVIKANLLNAATKVPDRDGNAWNNGQFDAGGFIRTSQAVDYDSGAGAMDLDRTYDQFLLGQTDITGNTGGVSFEGEGWDLAEIAGVGSTVDIEIPLLFGVGTDFTATLTWFRNRTEDGASFASDLGFADLDLQIWDATFTTLLGESVSDYNPLEHLHFALAGDTTIGLRIVYDELRFGSASDVDFAVAWAGTVVPEPASLALLIMAALSVVRRRSPA